MRIIITGRNIELTPGLKEAVEDKLSKLEKYFKPDTDVHVTLSVEKDRQKIEVTIPTKGHTIRTEQISNDMYVSIDLAEEAIERQLIKYRTKIISKKMNAAVNFKAEYLEEPEDDDEEIKNHVYPPLVLYANSQELCILAIKICYNIILSLMVQNVNRLYKCFLWKIYSMRRELLHR